MRGAAASARARRLYISTTRRLAAIDLKTDKIVWERSYEGHSCDRPAVSPDGQVIYAPAFGSAKWYVVHATRGELRASHGIALTPAERELWVADGVRNRLHVFDASVQPPVPIAAVDLAAQPRWIAFSIDGRYAYSSTGDVVGTATRKIIGALEDPAGAKVKSENILEIDFTDGQPIR